ncbi:GNAT family N-acetyltransferase [Alloacidobacterium dinghuense]|uniref:GNAT family N-acetyltransferase n=1 Tax=Alloacidobacterium dinghuense TaxID=2763107 RepID=A0A7G8BD61_9BACT|nr:GNAT family N-acetyltransferase [Alloacidobacterium dinghuense]
MSQSTWRLAQAADDDSIADMCRHLYLEDPGPSPIPQENIHTTLVTLRRSPYRGRAVVLDVQGKVSGYALLIAFWSNEFGGDICEVDELFVIPQHRNQGHGSALFAGIVQGELWPGAITAVALGTTRDNAAARRLYARLGFAEVGLAMICRIQQRVDLTAASEASRRNLQSSPQSPNKDANSFQT